MTETLTFGKTTAPAARSGRSIEPNPFDGHFPTAVTGEGDNIIREALTLELPGTADDNKAQVTNLTGKARRCAERLDVPMTARVQVTEEGKGKAAKTVLTIWTVDKITRKGGDVTENADA